MPQDSMPHVSLGTAILVIFAVCVVLVLLRGMARILTGSAILALSGWVGLATWHLAPEFSYQLFSKPITFILIALPLAAFATTFWMLHKLLQFILLPFDSLRSDDSPRTSLITSLVIAVIPTAILFLISASLFHHFGAIEEIRAFASTPDAEKPNRVRLFVRSCKSSLDRILPEEILRKLDPVTDPATGKPYPRAIIVDDPELQNLAREGKFGTLLRHPVLTKATQDPAVRKFLSRLNLQ